MGSNTNQMQNQPSIMSNSFRSQQQCFNEQNLASNYGPLTQSIYYPLNRPSVSTAYRAAPNVPAPEKKIGMNTSTSLSSLLTGPTWPAPTPINDSNDRHLPTQRSHNIGPPSYYQYQQQRLGEQSGENQQSGVGENGEIAGKGLGEGWTRNSLTKRYLQDIEVGLT